MYIINSAKQFEAFLFATYYTHSGVQWGIKPDMILEVMQFIVYLLEETVFNRTSPHLSF